MEYSILVAAAVLCFVLTGCTNTGISSVGQTICAHSADANLALDIAQSQANLIVDPVKRQAVLAAIDVSRSALASCPTT